MRTPVTLSLLVLVGCFDSTLPLVRDAEPPGDAGTAVDATPVPLDAFRLDAFVPPHDAGLCSPVEASDVRAPRVVETPRITVSAAVEGLGCSCAFDVDQDARRASAEICDCCWECDCIDLGYEAHLGFDLEHEEGALEVLGEVVPYRVRTRDECRPSRATGLRVVPPVEGYQQHGEPIWWAAVAGAEVLCCAAPAPLVVDADDVADTFSLEIYSCVEADCPCVGSPMPFEAWFPLGSLDPGEYTVTIDGIAQVFEVPE